MSRLTWLWRKSWILMRFTPVFLQPLVLGFDERAEHSPMLAQAIKAKRLFAFWGVGGGVGMGSGPAR